MSAHTPGPWEVSPPCELSPRCSVYHNGPLAYVDRIEDARLIAAAPALLDAARCALADLEGAAADLDPSGDRVHPVWRTIKELRDAIERATGGAP